jgi:hypothetical protein
MAKFLSARFRTALLQAGFAVLTGAGGPLEELPASAPPPDPQQLLEALRTNLPANWHMGQPYTFLGIPYVRVQIQDQWRGNPVAAVISLCPGPDDTIWQHARVIRLVMRHLQHDWPAYECRP